LFRPARVTAGERSLKSSTSRWGNDIATSFILEARKRREIENRTFVDGRLFFGRYSSPATPP
jgi:hypothetical protein